MEELKFAYTMLRIALLAILALMIMMIFSSYLHKQVIKERAIEISTLEDEIESLGIVIGEYEREILRDDKLLMGFTHGTWDRECKYRIDPWTQLADGSIREQIFQECEEK